MDRSRSSKRYYYEHQDYDHMDNRTTKHRHYSSFNNNHRRKESVTTSYRILCHDSKVGSVIAKSGSSIKAIRQHTGAWINVHDLTPGDHEKIIEVNDTRRRDPDGRMPTFSPAQEALMLINERILESDSSNLGHHHDHDDDVYGTRGNNTRLVSRLVVSRLHVGCLLGKGGKIIEQMRKETKTLIRILPRDHTIPRCVDISEEVVQVVGDMNSVKNAVDVITSRLRESQHRDRSHFHNRLFPPEDDFMHHSNNMSHGSSMDRPDYGSRLPAGLNGYRNFNHRPRASGYGNDIGASPVPDNAQSLYAEDLVFRILCPNNKVDNVIGQSNGLMDLLQNEIGVEVRVADRVVGSDEQIIIVSSDEGPDDDLFPAQEALLHIQTRILDLVPDKENIITTRLLLSAGEVGCLDGRDGFLTDTKKMTGADIQILPRENLPQFVSVNEELVQIVGEINAASEALIEVTLRLRSYLFHKDGQTSALLAPSPVRSASNMESAPNNKTTPRETYTGNDTTTSSNLNLSSILYVPKFPDNLCSELGTNRLIGTGFESGGLYRLIFPSSPTCSTATASVKEDHWYRCYSPSLHRYFTSADVTFNEPCPYFPECSTHVSDPFPDLDIPTSPFIPTIPVSIPSTDPISTDSVPPTESMPLLFTYARRGMGQTSATLDSHPGHDPEIPSDTPPTSEQSTPLTNTSLPDPTTSDTPVYDPPGAPLPDIPIPFRKEPPTLFVTFYPNFNMPLNDPSLFTALKAQIQIGGAQQVNTFQATFHYQMAYRVQNHCLDIMVPGHDNSGDALLIDIDSNAVPSVKIVPKQLSREELLNLLPEKWITNYEQIHQAPVQTTTAPDFVRLQDGLVELKFKKEDKRNVFSTMYMMQPEKTTQASTEHFPYDVCNCQSCLDEVNMVEYDEDVPKERKGKERIPKVSKEEI
ncbi:uncharacterized protein LOC143592966 [Bidens hawaiensis]|uniref:uncharacterized protein LOC143592966 n=1 Tax=Bidens hawaiensis TaxID=980011 RepID=UPI0040494386